MAQPLAGGPTCCSRSISMISGIKRMSAEVPVIQQALPADNQDHQAPQAGPPRVSGDQSQLIFRSEARSVCNCLPVLLATRHRP
jgi:hypothetical protein